MNAITPTLITTVKRAAAAEVAGGAALDLVSFDDVALELDVAASPPDAWTQKQISRASISITNYVNRVLQVQIYEDQFWARRDYYAHPWRDRSGHAPLQLTQWPLTSIPSTAGIAPPLSPALSYEAGGSLVAARYFVKVSYVTATGETASSLESNIQVPANSLLVISAPSVDPGALATGWNVYVGQTSFAETLQNASPLAMGSPFIEPTGGLVAGADIPNHVLVVENSPTPALGTPFLPVPLAEGIDFISDARHAHLSRLFLGGYTRAWPFFPLTVQYPAGYDPIPADVQEAAILLIKGRFFAKTRDPALRSFGIDVISESYFSQGAQNAASGMPPDVAGILDNYLVPLIG